MHFTSRHPSPFSRRGDGGEVLQTMPYKEKEPEKMFYTIGEVAAMFKVNVSRIRYWENEFDILQPEKNKKGNRLFTPADVEVCKVIWDLLIVQGLTLEGAKKYLKENKKAVKHEIKAEKNNLLEIGNKLRKIKKQLLEIKENL